MSLDVTLTMPGAASAEPRQAIFVRRNGGVEEISRVEWDASYPGCEPLFALVNAEDREVTEVYSGNITHNLGAMAEAAGIYRHLWRPEELGITTASELIQPLTEGLAKLKADPAKFEQFNASNGWGLYKHFVPFVEQYLGACREHPDAQVHADR